MKFLDPNDPVFRHAWVRCLVVVLPLVWGVVEFVWMQAPFWGILFLAAGAYAGYALFVQRDRD
ncbi:hypothetical protein [Rhodobacter calidifons]|uniref:DUF3329 domain-containing protein n=1 Tax=Rhodobacter calidifons TaxID=2715277 RepID=A0ABX0GB02_9RHOB|nr:hypothetical protein [Rhodobacter calidifons]NHB78157.1 hypothetical protein [Rhodobacter calidifons]